MNLQTYLTATRNSCAKTLIPLESQNDRCKCGESYDNQDSLDRPTLCGRRLYATSKLHLTRKPP